MNAIIASFAANYCLDNYGPVSMFSMFAIMTFFGTIYIALVTQDTTYAKDIED